jgi:hypothetical protein
MAKAAAAHYAGLLNLANVKPKLEAVSTSFKGVEEVERVLWEALEGTLKDTPLLFAQLLEALERMLPKP